MSAVRPSGPRLQADLGHATRSTWAILPFKGVDRSKSRLAPALAQAERHAVASALFQHVLRAAHDCALIDHVLVASRDARAAVASERVSLLRDPQAEMPFGRVLDRALAHAHAHGAQRAVIVLGDLPLVTGRDIAELVASLCSAPLVVAPDLARRGVGAVGCVLPAPFPMQLGRVDSFFRTMQHARAHHVPAQLVLNPRLGRDIDTAADLAALATLTGDSLSPR